MPRPVAPCINCGPDDRTPTCHSTCDKYIQFINENKVYREQIKAERLDTKPIYTEGRLRILNRNMKGGKH